MIPITDKPRSGMPLGVTGPGIQALSALVSSIPSFFVDLPVHRAGAQQPVALDPLTLACNQGGRKILTHHLQLRNLTESLII